MKNNFNEYIFDISKRPKLAPKAWIKFNELNKYSSELIWLTSATKYSGELKTLMSNIKRLVSKSGWNFTFLYLKETTRLLIRALSGSPEPTYLSGIVVSRDSRGLPRIIPINLRDLFAAVDTNQYVVRSVLTLLSVYRVFPTKPAVSLDTITSPFNGVAKTLLNLRPAVDEICKSSFKLRAAHLIKLETSGPNASKSAWSSSLDSLAFIHKPRLLLEYVRYCIHSGNVRFALWLLMLIAIGSVPYFVFLTLGLVRPLAVGKLGVVLDQAGKARVIAICSYWLQLILKPLHNSLFEILKRLKTDGTFDQHAPLDILISKGTPGSKFHCFDLSAATDRLPLELQVDILNILQKGLGDRWKSVLSFPWIYRGKSILYSVGQPMGAYSSWGMLAVTHHVIIRYCSLKCGIKDFDLYAVLGDDVVIMHDDVAREYLHTMQILGVSINLSKSIVSSRFAEFAKVWRGPSLDLTPMGPGLLLRSLRDSKFKGVLLGEAVRLNLLESLPQLLGLISSLKNPLLALWSTLGLGSAVWRNHADAQAITWGISSTHNPRLFIYCLGNAVKQLSLDDYREAKLNSALNYEYFLTNWWKIYSSNTWPLRTLEALFKLVGPGLWIYASSFKREQEKFKSSPPIHTYGMENLSDIRTMVELDDTLSLSSIDWREKKEIKRYDSKINKLNDEFERTLSEVQDFGEMF